VSARDRDKLKRGPPRGDTRTGGSRWLVLGLIPLTLLAVGSLVSGAYQLFPFCCLPLLILGPALLPPEAGGPADDGEGPDDNGGRHLETYRRTRRAAGCCCPTLG
jgi:hypothetical protein